MIILNTIMADSLDYMATVLETPSQTARASTRRCRKLLTEIITEHGAVVFNVTDTRRTGRSRPPSAVCRTSRRRSTPFRSCDTEAIEVFEKYGVFNARELHSAKRSGTRHMP